MKHLLGILLLTISLTGFARTPFIPEIEDRFADLEASFSPTPTLTGAMTGQSADTLSNGTDDTWEFLSNDEVMTLQVSGFEAKNAVFKLCADQADDAADCTTFTMSTAGAFTTDKGIAGDGGDNLVGFLSPLVLATATTLTAAQCGSTFYNGGAVEVELPEASTVPGCTYTFVVLNAANFTIDPDAADIIVLLTNSAGDSLIADAVGETLMVRAVSASQWVTVSTPYGTWTDSN
jgi:hypothetical protein